ncbi:Two-component response regulator, SAPR family, consists of REC, wHTH and BTAD domains [Desulforamulus aeronauticus DSM 10349]|uniref:Stage 0 sporulation protein A homolog n=1 Tax=Desulforamulus aeronauticus DSM 10349 TaxID=1121421 RepID=A0A1M6XA01_9FIRM|nr:Two-component response regulator, SAPR family, consists of REC, wHTH and BTAD domains [Desulforamulus aeronauticus DSM 10349]
MLRAIAVDDEILALCLLENLLQEIGGVNMIGTFTDITRALPAIVEEKPDIVFLDVEMPDQNGLSLAEQLTDLNDETNIVFVTAYEHYALQAFGVRAADYILKPIEKDRLAQTIRRFLKWTGRVSRLDVEKRCFQAHFLGNFSLRDPSGDLIKWRTKKVKELCAYLLHHRQPVHRSQIIDDLWPAVAPDKGSILLHSTVYQLRKTLKSLDCENPILYAGEFYTLCLEAESDVHEIEEILTCLSPANEQVILNLLQYANKDYLEQEDWPWSLGAREKLREACKHCLEGYVFSTPATSSKRGARRASLEKLIDMEPFEERYIQELIRHHLDLGNRRKALETYRKLEKLLTEELGEKPQLETLSLVQNLF